MRRVMTDVELLAWLAKHGTEIPQAELEAMYPRVFAAVERKEARRRAQAESTAGSASGDEGSGDPCDPKKRPEAKF